MSLSEDDEAASSERRKEALATPVVTQAYGKRKRTNDVSGELTAEDVKEIIDSVSEKRKLVLHYIGTEKVSKDRQKLSDFVTEISNALTKLSSAYLSKLSAENVAETCEKAIYRTCNTIEIAANKLNTAMPNISVNTGGSYAEAAAHCSREAIPSSHAKKISLSRGKSFTISNSDRVFIGPVNERRADFASGKDTQAVLRNAIDPAELKISVQRVSFGPSSTVCVEGSALNALRECPRLAAAGLEVKSETKLNPRLMIHDIPIELSGEYIVKSVIDQNLPDAAADDVNLVCMYPTRNGKKHCSCVIETSPIVRSYLPKRQKVNIGWSACRVNDHVTVLQCYKCQRFGHLANNCTNAACCCHCAGEHISKDCKSKNVLRCVNCQTAKLPNGNHAASDKGKYPILRKKIEHKISRTNYGEC